MDIYSDQFFGKKIKDLQFASMWVLELPDLTTLPNPPMTTINGVAVPNTSSQFTLKPQAMDLYLKSTTLPLRKLEYEKTNTNLVTAKGRAEYSDFTMTFLETDDWAISSYFDYWLNSIFDFTETEQVYKKNFEKNKLDLHLKFIKLYNTTLSPFLALASPIQQTNLLNQGWTIYQTSVFTLKRTILEGYEDINLENESGDPLEIEVSFQCENIEIDHTNRQIKSSMGNILANPYS